MKTVEQLINDLIETENNRLIVRQKIKDKKDYVSHNQLNVWYLQRSFLKSKSDKIKSELDLRGEGLEIRVNDKVIYRSIK